LVEELSSCDFDPAAFTKLLTQIQKSIDHLNLENYSNLDVWVANLTERIDGVLRARLVHAVGAWCSEFVRDEANGDDKVGPLYPSIANPSTRPSRSSSWFTRSRSATK
jgi:hypothetical protein